MPISVPTHETPHESRLQTLAPWQAMSVVVVACVLTIPLLFGPRMLADRMALGAFEEPILVGVLGVLGALVVFPGIAIAIGVSPGAWFIRRPSADVLRWIGVTSGMVGVVVLAPFWTDPTGSTLQSIAAPELLARVAAAIAIGLWTAVIEELLLRGVILSMIGHRWHWPGAIVVTALLFGLLHQGGGSTPVAATLYVLLTGIAGLFLGVLVVATGNVWNAVAVHATWNAAFAGYVIGIDPSARSAPVLVAQTDPGWLLGAGDAAISESPLAIALFVLVLVTYTWRLQSSE